jgi:hypothetical protein
MRLLTYSLSYHLINMLIAFSLSRLVPVQKRDLGENGELAVTPKKSALTELITTALVRGKSESSGITLVIYILDSGESVSINVASKSRVIDIIKTALKEHYDKKMRPPLEYATPQAYVLRLHDEDGVPDLDFPPFGYDEEVESIHQTSQSNEFCLCETGDDDNTSDDSDIIAMRGIKPSPVRGPPPPMYRGENASVSDETSTRPDPMNDTTGSGVSISRALKLAENAILISIPNTGIIGVNINERTTLRDILPLIATKHRLRMYSDEFCFVMAAEELKRLNVGSHT